MAVVEAQPTKMSVVTRKRRSTRRLGIVVTQIGILAAILALWQFAVTDASLPYFSRPSLIAAKLYELLSHHDIYRQDRKSVV